MTLFKGSGVAIITPFHDNGDINHPKLNQLVDWQIKAGTDAIIICGTTGEASTMSDTEHLACIRTAVEAAAGRVPVIAGTGSNDTRHGINLSRQAEQLGVDGLLQVTPYYNKTTQAGLLSHFGAIADSVNLPIMLYNVPSRTGLTIEADTAKQLAEKHHNITSIKEASGNIEHTINLVHQTNGLLDLYSGNDDQTLPLLALGSCGVISVAGNLLPTEMHQLVHLYLEGKHQASLDLHLKLHGLMKALFYETNPIPIKEAMNLCGHAVGPCRLPLVPMSTTNRQRLIKELVTYGLLDN